MSNSDKNEDIDISLTNDAEKNINENLNFLKIKHIDLEEITNKLIEENEFIRIITNKNIKDDSISNPNISEIEGKIIKNYGNNLTKEIESDSDKIRRNIKIQINDNDKKYFIYISFIRITNNENNAKQQYTLSLEFQYQKLCNINFNNFCFGFCKFFCQQIFCEKCCQKKYENEINNYLDNI
jgi:hypothetical protein